MSQIIFRWCHCSTISLLVIVIVSHSTSAHLPKDTRSKRQIGVSLDDIIEGALNLVRPIIDTSKSLREDDNMIPKKKAAEEEKAREVEILGAPRYSSLDDVPICKGHSTICKFISCTAHNFKNDESFSNLHLATQVLADSKLRKQISRDPDALNTICHEQGLRGSQCRLFAKGFELIDKFISTIEPHEFPKRQSGVVIHEDPYKEEIDAPAVPIRPHSPVDDPPVRGSKTWSSHAQVIEPVTQFPPPPSLPTLLPLMFTLPSLPTFPPIAAPIPIEPFPPKDPPMLSQASSFNFDNAIVQKAVPPPFQIFPTLTRLERSATKSDATDFDDPSESGDLESEQLRSKRSDYYDHVETDSSGAGPPTHSVDVFSQRIPPTLFDDAPSHRTVVATNQNSDNRINCMQFLD